MNRTLIILVVASLLVLTGCTDMSGLTIVQIAEVMAPGVETVSSSLTTFTLLNNEKTNPENKLYDNLIIYVAAADGLSDQLGHIDLADLKILAVKYLPAEYGAYASPILDYLEVNINSLPQVQNPDDKTKAVQILCKAVVDGMQNGISQYVLMLPSQGTYDFSKQSQSEDQP